MTELDRELKRLDDMCAQIGETAKDIESRASFSRSDLVDMVREEMCDNYCRFPRFYAGDDERLKLKCDRCPLRLLK